MNTWFTSAPSTNINIGNNKKEEKSGLFSSKLHTSDIFWIIKYFVQTPADIL